jgi:DNA polymerase III subunit epsilon
MTAAATAAEDAYREARAPEAGTPWREAEYTVIDLETTGLDPSADEIISFAAITVADGRIRLRDARYELVRPRRMPDAHTIRIHGLREADLEQAPPLAERLDELLAALAGRALVAHVAAIESRFLSAALRTRGLTLENPVLDTAELALELRRRRREAPPAHPPGLSELARSLRLPVHRPHHADGDALTTAQVFLALAAHLERFEPLSLGALERLSRPPRPLSRRWLWRRARRGRAGAGPALPRRRSERAPT